MHTPKYGYPTFTINVRSLAGRFSLTRLRRRNHENVATSTFSRPLYACANTNGRKMNGSHWKKINAACAALFSDWLRALNELAERKPVTAPDPSFVVKATTAPPMNNTAHRFHVRLKSSSDSSQRAFTHRDPSTATA